MDRNNITINKISTRNLIRRIDEGRFAIPKLQREFVWDGPKAAKLLDSMYAGMPIGVVMVWQTPKAQRLYLRQKYHVLPPFNDRNPKVWFLIDGQQRVSVIHHVREGSSLRNARRKEIDFSRVVLSLEKQDDGQQIRYRKPIPGLYESLSDVLHPQWHNRLSHLTQRQKKHVELCRQQIFNYRIHLMFIRTDIDQIRESFLRINTQGMKVTTADAIFTKAENLDLRDIHHEVLQHLDDAFAEIGEMPILFAMSAVRGASEARGEALRQVIHRLEREAKEDRRLRRSLTNDWHKLSRCFGKAVDFMRQNFKVLNRDFLYSDYMVSMVALFYYWNGRGPGARQKEQINKWFWATSVGSRYTGRNFLVCLPSDLKFFKKLARNSNMRFTYRPQVERVDLRKAQYASRAGITSAFYCLLLKRGPVSIMDGGINEIPLERYATNANRKDRHHIFPQRAARAADIPANLYNSVCNVCVLTAEENQQIGFRRPRLYLADVQNSGSHFKKKMARHFIPVEDDSGIWTRNLKRGFHLFLKCRAEHLSRALETEAGTRLFRRDL